MSSDTAAGFDPKGTNAFCVRTVVLFEKQTCMVKVIMKYFKILGIIKTCVKVFASVRYHGAD